MAVSPRSRSGHSHTGAIPTASVEPVEELAEPLDRAPRRPGPPARAAAGRAAAVEPGGDAVAAVEADELR